MLPEDLNLLPLVNCTLIYCVRGGQVDDLSGGKCVLFYFSKAPGSIVKLLLLIQIILNCHLAKENSIVHLLIHVGTVFLQWKFVVHILFKESNHYHQFDHNLKNYQAYQSQ